MTFIWQKTTCRYVQSHHAVLAYLKAQLACLASWIKQIDDDSLQRFGEVTERPVSTWSTLEQVAFIRTGGSRRSVA